MSKLNGITSEKIAELYRQRMTLQQIGAAFGITSNSVLYHLKKLDVPRRTGADMYSEVRRKYALKENFFSRWSSEMAWVLGLICTDGNLCSRTSKVTLTSIDIDLLEKVKSVLGFDGPITRVNSQSAACRLTICRNSVYNDLLALGLTPAKSLTIKWPQVPRQFMRHFLRGIFEGDGCFHWSPRGSLIISLVSGSQAFIAGAQAELSQMEAFSKHGYRLSLSTVYSNKNPLHYLTFSAYKAVEEFYWWLYESVPESMSMARKRRIIESFLDAKEPNRMYVEEMALAA